MKESNAVTVTDIDISFGQMVVLILKFTLACIPAAMVIAVGGVIVTMTLAAFGMALK